VSIRINQRARFRSYIRYRPSVTVIGCGSVGSNIVRIAHSMDAASIDVYDADTVENANTMISFLAAYPEKKVVALLRALETVHGHADNVHVTEMEFSVVTDRDSLFSDVVVLAVDSIPTRLEIFEAWTKAGGPWLVDFRVAGTYASAFFVRRDRTDYNWYRSVTDVNDTYARMPCGQESHPAVTSGWCTFVFSSFLAVLCRREEWPYRFAEGGALGLHISYEMDGGGD